ncbi:MAG: squalene cyclase [Candidatus Paceibacteria bacterium]|jgi:squalene cyclase
MRRTTLYLKSVVLALALGTASSFAQGLDLPPLPTDQTPIDITPEQTAAVKQGLQWLADHQNEDGSWTAKIGYKLNNDYNFTSKTNGHVGVTSLACMAFLGGGNLPGRGPYGEQVERGLGFILDSVQEDGYITRHRTRMYSHAFATLCLAEVYGTTRREDVRRKLQKAVDFIVKSQNREGGWRYEPYAIESDMSIVVCQVLALRAARNIGIRVPKETVDSAARYVVDSAVTGTANRSQFGRFGGSSMEVGTFRYQKDDFSRSSFALTAAGVTALHGLGIYSDSAIERGIEFLIREMPRFNQNEGRRSRGHYFFWYGHYYGVQAMYTVGSPYWEPYFQEVRTLLLGMQNADGSWSNRTGPGDAFGTAVGVLILEIPFRFLPIFQR